METILPAPDTLELLTLLAASQAITAVVRSRAEGSRCPMCHQLSTRVHSRYCRHLLDLPWQGVAMRIDLHVRRFFCDTPECIRQIFTERLSDIVTPYACRTKRLDA